MANFRRTIDNVATENRLELVGKLAFVIGVLFAIIGGIWGIGGINARGVPQPSNDWIVLILIIAGILIGLLNITAKEAPVVLIAVVALLILAIWGNSAAFEPVYHLSQGLGENVVGIVNAFAILMAPAAIIIAIRAVLAAAAPGD